MRLSFLDPSIQLTKKVGRILHFLEAVKGKSLPYFWWDHILVEAHGWWCNGNLRLYIHLYFHNHQWSNFPRRVMRSTVVTGSRCRKGAHTLNILQCNHSSHRYKVSNWVSFSWMFYLYSWLTTRPKCLISMCMPFPIYQAWSEISALLWAGSVPHGGSIIVHVHKKLSPAFMSWQGPTAHLGGTGGFPHRSKDREGFGLPC